MNNKLRYLTILSACAVVVAVLAGCSPRKTAGYVSVDGFGLGTSYHISAEVADTAGLRASIDSVFRLADRSMSVFNPQSLLSRLNRNETDSVDAHVAYCVELASRISDLSGGVYDITIKPLSEAWGFTGRGAQERPNLDFLLQFVGYKKISIEDGRLIKQRPEIQIDLNSIAKGYTVDLLARMLEARGVGNYLVEVGGEIFCRGVNQRGTTWTVGVDRPEDGNFVPGAEMDAYLTFSGEGLATSGNYRRFYTDAAGAKVVHTINAVTGESRPSNLLSATVIAENTATADALATMMMAVGLEQAITVLEANPQWKGYLIYHKGYDAAQQRDIYGVYYTESMKKHIISK